MAERGAHITQTTKVFKNFPSIFDAVATDSLSSFEAMKKITFMISQQKPNWNSSKFIRKFYAEIYFLCNVFIQNYFLKKYGTSFAEYFYGLVRKNKSGTFGQHDLYRSLMTLVLLPYVYQKIKAFLDEIQLKIGGLANSEQLKYERIIKYYKNATTIFEAAKLLQILGFFCQKTTTPLLSLQLCNLRLEYAVVEPVVNCQDDFKASLNIVEIFSELCFRSLGVSAFFIQFIQSFQNDIQYNKLENLPSPVMCNKTVVENDNCPICLQKFELPTVVQISSIVYCYKCIHLHLQNKGNYCPVTFFATSVKDLITLYEEEN